MLWLAWLGVFPTGVGVDRFTFILDKRPMGFPHRRGGGPSWVAGIWNSGAFSPQAWGWTVLDRTLASMVSVFPTGVGVDRRNLYLPAHTRRFSPQAWGWTVVHNFGAVRRGGFPHRRGGGPD